MIASHRVAFRVSVLVLLLLSACSGGQSGQPLVYGKDGVAQSDVPRDASGLAGAKDVGELVAGNTAFALDLYRQLLPAQDGNIFISPHSISQALAMTYAGARTDTGRQMALALRFSLPQDRLHAAFNSLDLELASRGKNAKARDGKGFRLNIVNAVWGQDGYPFLKGYLDLLAQNYGAGLRLLNFMTAPDAARVTINDWVSARTEGKVKDLLPRGVITSDTRMVLTNAIYFNAGWAFPFEKGHTADAPFHLSGGGTVNVPMMAQTYYFNYAEGEACQAAELPYDGGELSMVIILPGPGRFADFEESLTAGQLNAILGGLSPQHVSLKLPRFTFASEPLSLKERLRNMGMTDAFTDQADFSGIDGSRRLLISDVIHKSFLAVDEYGTEAAAATAVIVGPTSVPPPPVEFTADRPFILLIRDIRTGAVLFLGRIVNPAG